MPSVLFVCTANLDRSPWACARLRQWVAHDVDGRIWRIESAGTWAKPGLSAPPEVLAVGREHSLDLSTHRSRSVTRDLLQSFKLVLAMEHGHKEALRVEFPAVESRVFLLCEMAGVQASIYNPEHRTVAEYRRLTEEIDQWLRLGYNKIIQLAQP